MAAGRVAAAAALAGTLLLSSCGQGAHDVRDRGAGTWSELPAAPLSPRIGAVAAWTGTEALFLGGDVGNLCPPTASCVEPPESARDGAAFDPAAGAWRRTADAPRPIPGGTPVAVGGDTAHLLLEDRLLSYDASDDAWSESPPVPGDAWVGGAAALDDGTVVVVSGERGAEDPAGQVYDPGPGTWAELPEDPIGPAFDRLVTAIPGAVVLTAKSLVPDPGSAGPAVVRAAVLDLGSGGWRLLDDSDQIGGWRWAWTGSRLVDPTPGGADGGETGGWGRTVPYGGLLDPVTGTWDRLPDGGDEAAGGWPVEALGGPVSAAGGRLYDDRDGSWTTLRRPDDAPPQPGSAVWAGDRLVVVGGLDSDSGWGDENLTDRAWMWTPGPPGAGAEDDVTDDLAGAWVLEEGTSRGAPIDIPTGGRATLVVQETTFGGTAFCNGYGGEYDVDGSTLVLSGLGGTDMACAPDLMAAEDAYLSVLRGGRLDVSREDGGLLLRADEGTLRFRSLPPVPVGDVVGTRWVLQALVTGGSSSSAARDPAVLVLRHDGTVTGSTGCRDLTGTWDTVGDEVRFPDLGFDAVVDCPAGTAAQDGHVVGVLEGGFSVSVDGDVLTATEAGGTGLVYRAG